LQLEFVHGILGGSRYFAIRNNSSEGLSFGHPQKEGVQALINFICDQVCLSGCHVLPFAAFVMHIVHDCFKEVMKILGCKHDCDDMSALMQALMKEQGDRGKFSQEHRDNM
jgi:uncharacterized membrane protein YjgN (DUF898 family)